MPITAEQAWDATDPSHPDEARHLSAQNILQGVAAQDAYLSSRGELERLKVLASGPQVVTHAELNVTDATSEEVPEQPPAGTLNAAPEDESASDEAKSDDAETTLRKQLEAAGLKPEA